MSGGDVGDRLADLVVAAYELGRLVERQHGGSDAPAPERPADRDTETIRTRPNRASASARTRPLRCPECGGKPAGAGFQHTDGCTFVAPDLS